MKLKCKRCLKLVEIIISPAGPHTKASCAECGKYIKFLSTNEMNYLESEEDNKHKNLINKGGSTMEEMQFDSDFNVDDEYKEDPLAPAGTYQGHVVQVTFDSKQQAIVWRVILADNGGTMSDGETPIDGSAHYFRNWLPRAGDENLQTPSGRSNKRQAKINMMKKFAEGMQISMNTKDEIIRGISEGLWMGIPVFVKINLDTYQGVTRNVVDQMIRNIEGDRIEVKEPDADDIPF